MIVGNIGDSAQVQEKSVIAQEQFLSNRNNGGALSAEGNVHSPQVAHDVNTGNGGYGSAIAQLAGHFFGRHMKGSVPVRGDQLYLVLQVVALDESVYLLP